MLRRLFRIFFFLTLPLQPLFAQERLEILPSAYGLKNGLADNNVVDGLFDDKNYLWLATANGISCFDGQHFVNYDANDPDFKISYSSVNSLARIGSTVFAATDKGIDAIDVNSKKSRVFYSSQGGESIVSLFAAVQGQLIAIADKGICRNLTTGKSVQLPFRATEYFIAADETGHLYISSFQKDYCVIDLKSHQITSYVQKRDIPNYGLLYKKDLGLISLNYLGIYKNNLLTKKEEPFLITTDIVNGFTDIDAEHFLTIRDFNRVVYHTMATPGTKEIRLLQTGNAIYKKIIVDKNGVAVLLTNTGIYCFKLPLHFQTQVPDHYLTDQAMVMVRRAMVELPDKNIALLSYRGIQEYNPVTGMTKIISSNPLVLYSAVTDSSAIWVGTDGMGLYRFDLHTKRFGPVIKTNSGLKSEHIFSICREPDGKLLLGYFIPFGLREYDPKTGQITPVPIPYGNIIPAHSRISHISRDEQGHYWVATDNGLFELDAAKKFLFRYDATSGNANQHLPSIGTNYCCHVAGNRVWVATDNGIALIDKANRQIVKLAGVKQNLAGEKCVAILEDTLHRLWISTYNGLSCYLPESDIVYNFYKEDGLPDDEYNYMAALQTSEGLLYFGGLNGVVRIEPAKWQGLSAMATLNISLVNKEDEKGNSTMLSEEACLEGLKITRSKEAVELHFGFREFINPGYCKYWYRIKEISENWTELGNNGHLRLWNLPAGNYTVQLRGHNAKGVSSEKILEIPLSVIQPFYQSLAFKISIVVLVLGLLSLFLWQRYADQKAIRSIKTGMLNDIHDEVGSILTKTAMKAELLNLKFGNEIKELQEIQRYSREAIQSLRNLLWSISSEKMATQDFEDRINDWLKFLFADTGYEVAFINQIPDKKFIDSVEVRRNIVLIIKELAHNTLKHAGGDKFSILLDKKEGKYYCLVTDNGRNTNNTLEYKGYGLKSIESRVAAIGGKVKFMKTAEGFKTEILF